MISEKQSDSKGDECLLRWKKGVVIGGGAYGNVYECLNLDTGELHAVKEISVRSPLKNGSVDLFKLKRKIEFIKKLKHKYIQKYLAIEVDHQMNRIYIISEYASGGSVRKLIDSFGKLQEAVVKKYTSQLTQAIAFLHSHKIVHRDIKCSNLLLEKNGTLKLGDLDSCKCGTETVNKSLVGTPYWMAPEVAASQLYSPSSDIWSLGCTVIEMLSGFPPFFKELASVKDAVESVALVQVPPEFPKGISSECQNFLERCLQVQPHNRASAQELMSHRFLCSKQRTESEVSLSTQAGSDIEY